MQSFNPLTQLITASAVALSLLFAPVSSAAIDDASVASYFHTAKTQDYSQLKSLYKQMQAAQQADPGDGWTLFFLGATDTLRGDDALLPWNKLSHTEDGLARIDKALSMIDERQWQKHYQHLPQALHMQANAAISFTSVPEMFGYSQRGIELFRQLLASENLQHLPAEAVSWIYLNAIKAAVKHQQPQLATQWHRELQQRGGKPSEIQQADSWLAQLKEQS